MTNADRIRQMTDEELAEIIMCPVDGISDICFKEKKDCIQCCHNWLRQEDDE